MHLPNNIQINVKRETSDHFKSRNREQKKELKDRLHAAQKTRELNKLNTEKKSVTEIARLDTVIF